MTKLSAGIAGLLVFLMSWALAPAAQGYPDPTFNVSVDRQVVYGGQTYTATATADVNCAWTLTWNGEGRTGAGTRFVTTYVAPAVQERTRIPLRATCEYAASASVERTIMITVLPRESQAAAADNDSLLPNTGGPRLLLLLAGLALLAAGVAAAVRGRSRGSAEEPTASAQP